MEPFDEPYEPHEIIQNKKDLYINKFYCSKKDKLKNNFSENYEEIYEDAKGYKNSFFDLLSQKDNLKYLQLIGIFINKDNLNKINILVENLKNFLFLKGFCLVVEDESIINKKDILDIIDNLSKLNLIENIKIEVKNIKLNKSDEKKILDCIEGITINNKKGKIQIKLNGDISNNIFKRIPKKLHYVHY